LVSILWRSWLTFSVVIATVLAVLATLSILQHNAILSELIRQRIAVVAHTTAASFRSIVDLGLPLSAMRNGNEIVARALQTDPRLSAIHVFDPAGVKVYTTAEDRAEPVSRAILRAQALADGVAWSVETANELDSGSSVVNRAGDIVGGVVVGYAKDAFNARADAMAMRTISEAIVLWLAFSVLAFVILRILLAAPLRGLARLEALPEQLRKGHRAPLQEGSADSKPTKLALLDGEIEGLKEKLIAAFAQFSRTEAELGRLAHEVPTASVGTAQEPGNPSPAIVEQSEATSLARIMARRLAPWAALLIVVSALILGTLTLRNVNSSVAPELAARTGLIGTVVSANVQRAVSAGIPLNDLVGADRYFGGLLHDLPEVAYIAVAAEQIVLEAGQPVDPHRGRSRATYPIVFDDEQIGNVIIDIDPTFISRQFLDVFLDLGVVVLVTVMLAFEVMVLMLSRSLTAPLDRLQHLATLQAAGDFSRRLTVGTRNTIDRIAALLSDNATAVNRTFARVFAASAGSAATRVQDLAQRHGLSTDGPGRLILSYFTDIRLALFLFATADQLPLSFLPLYTRAADNPWGWLDKSVVISLPIAGYLAAIMAGAPFARTLSQRVGHRNLLVFAMLLTLLPHLGLYNATSVPAIVLYRTLTGFGYAIVTLACQDYLLDVVPKGQRDRALGLFATVLFGGLFCGTALGGVLADRLGQASVFLVSSVLIAISALLTLRLLSDAERAGTQSELAPLIPAIWAPLAHRRFAVLVLGIAIPANVLLQAFISYLVALVLDSLGASISDIGRTLMLYYLMIAMVGPLAARAAEGRVPTAYVAATGAILAGAGLALPVVWPGQLMVLVAVMLAGIGHGMVRGPQVSLAMTIAETELAHLGSAAVLGGLRTLERGGSILGLLAVAYLAGSLGYAAAIAAVSFWVLGGAVLFLISTLADRALVAKK
jgi:predicted MFS family arabinose efflux permease